MTIVKVENEETLINRLALLIEKIANESIGSQGKFFVGLSGGSLIKFLGESLPQLTTDWSKWVLAFCDERVVPEASDDSTFGTYKREILSRTKLKEEQFIRIKQGVTAVEAAEDYTKKLIEAFGSDNFVFDLLLLGMGPDGHTCSLFPGHPLLEETVLSVAPIVDSPKPPSARITLTFPVINKAKNCIFALSGAGKADMVKRILKDKEDLPSTRVKPAGTLYWILDKAAAAQL